MPSNNWTDAVPLAVVDNTRIDLLRHLSIFLMIYISVNIVLVAECAIRQSLFNEFGLIFNRNKFSMDWYLSILQRSAVHVEVVPPIVGCRNT